MTASEIVGFTTTQIQFIETADLKDSLVIFDDVDCIGNKAIKKKTADELIGLTKAYSESKLPDMTYIPYPASWLNKGLYEPVEVQENKPLQKLKIGKWHE
jgi:hypothetical protein